MRGNRYLSDEEIANKPKVTKELLLRIGSYLFPYYKQMTLVLILIIVSSTFSLAPSIITGKIIDEGLIKQDLPM
jgi:ATP-binding cassette subfamily B protein